MVQTLNKKKFHVYTTAYTNLLSTETQNRKFKHGDIRGLLEEWLFLFWCKAGSFDNQNFQSLKSRKLYDESNFPFYV
jgi:hypothetical protein